jgi:hypothetical protein
MLKVVAVRLTINPETTQSVYNCKNAETKKNVDVLCALR